MPLYNLQSPGQLFSPQIGAVSANRAPKINYESYIENMASALPALEEATYQRQMQEEQISLDQEARRQAQIDSRIALGIQGANTLTPLATKYGGGILNALKPKPVVMATPPYVPPTPSYSPLDTGLQYKGGAPTPISYGNEPVLPGLAMRPSTPTIPTTVDAQGTGLFSQIGGHTGYLNEFGKNMGLPSEISSIGTNLATAGINYGLNRAIVGKKATGSEQIVSDLATSATSFVLGGPPGLAINLLRIGGRELFKKCIIVSACYDKDSEELKTARAYRDKFFTKEILRGYYAYSEPIVDLMNKYPEVKEHYRITLVEPLLRVARFKLKLSQERPSAMDCAVAMNMTNIWHDTGLVLKKFTRSNGEEV